MKRIIATLALTVATGCSRGRDPVAPDLGPYVGNLDWVANGARFEAVPSTFDATGASLRGHLAFPLNPADLPEIRDAAGVWTALGSAQHPLCGEIFLDRAGVVEEEHSLDLNLVIHSRLCGEWALSGRLVR